MSVQRRVNWISQQRVDVPDMRSVESAASNDWDQGIQALITNTSQGYILRGFEISMTGAIGGASSSLQMVMQDNNGNPASLLHIAASQSGTVLMVPPGTPAQQLNGATNSNVTGSFVPNALNYIGVDYTRYIDPTTDAQVYIWDPTTNTETSMTAPRAQILQFVLNISTSAWPSNILPIAIVQTDAGNNVVSITDCRWLLFRLGTGGADPNPFFTYPWDAQPEGRTENPSTSASNGSNPFEGGDKMLFSMKDWMNAVMSSLLELNGGTYWYSAGTAGSISKLREDLGNTFTAGTGTVAHGVLPNNDPILSTTASITSGSYTMTLASTSGLTNGDQYFAFATGLPYGASFTYSGSATVTLSVQSTITNPTATVNVFIPAAVTAPGQINWSDPIYLKVVGSALSYEIAANPTSTDIVLADDEVAYMTLTRDATITPNLFYTYNSVPNTTTVVSIGSVAWTASLLAGDFLRASADSDNLYTEIKSVDSTSQVTLYGNYVPAGQTAVGVQSVYAFGSYSASASPSSPRNIYIATRADVPNGQDVWWLFSREDLGGVNPTVYVRFIGTVLNYGDSNQIDDGIPKELLQYIGSPTESASKPQYASALNPGSIAQIVSITTGAASTVVANQYFTIYSSTASRFYYVWINKDGTGADPKAYANGIPLEWDVTTGQTAAQLASSLAVVLNDTYFADFSAVAVGSVVTVTNNSAGASAAPANINVGAPFAISISTTGTGVGNFVVQDGDNLTLGIKLLDDQINSIVSGMIGPGYDETVDIVSVGAVPPSSLTGPIAPSTSIQLPPNSRNGNIQLYYEVGAGKLEVFLNGQKLVVGVDYTEVGASGSASYHIQNSYTLVDGDQLEFTFGGGGGAGGGGEIGPQGPAGPAGSPGTPGTGPVNISTYTSSFSPSVAQNTILANCTSAPITVTLPTPASSTGYLFYIKKIDASANALTIVVAGGANIDYASSQSTTVQGYSWTVICDGTQYWLF
jgi:hypothetical protein